MPAIKSMASFIDHTLLRPDATGEQIDNLCQEAKAVDTPRVFRGW